jgi:riboflavin transporter FmnP
VFSAIATILHIFNFSLPFLAPFFYEMDFAELPVLIVAFAYGPVAGVLIELCKTVLKLFIVGTSTAFVGELANFVMSCAYILPASIIYYAKKSKKTALFGCIIGTVCLAAFSTVFNALYLIPTFARMFMGNNIEVIIGMGRAVNSLITSVWTLALFAVLPFNLLKGTVISILTMLVYKKLSPVMKKG